MFSLSPSLFFYYYYFSNAACPSGCFEAVIGRERFIKTPFGEADLLSTREIMHHLEEAEEKEVRRFAMCTHTHTYICRYVHIHTRSRDETRYALRTAKLCRILLDEQANEYIKRRGVCLLKDTSRLTVTTRDSGTIARISFSFTDCDMSSGSCHQRSTVSSRVRGPVESEFVE